MNSNYQPTYYPNGAIPPGMPEGYSDPTQVPMSPADTDPNAFMDQKQRIRQVLNQQAALQSSQQGQIVPVTQPQAQPIVVPVIIDVTIMVKRVEE